jgi:hypothetical protein
MIEQHYTDIKPPLLSVQKGCRIYCHATVKDNKVTHIYTNALVFTNGFIKHFC